MLAEIRAGGTLAQAPEIACPDAPRRIRLILEMGLLFVAAPVLVTYAVYGLRIPLFLALQPVLLGCIAFLAWDGGFDLRRELLRGVSGRTLVSILLVFLLAGIAIALVVAHELPRAFLAFPRLRPATWLSVIVLYPLLSVLAQELVFRTFFFHRYGPVFADRRGVAVAVNGGLFGFAHIMFYNPVAIGASTVLGCLLAWRYASGRSIWSAVIEHTLYGWLIFTVGLGSYFFTGIANPGW